MLFPAFAGLPVFPHAFEQVFHPLRAFNRVANELIRILAELAFVFPGEELGIACHHAERLLKVMRGGVGEVLEIIVHVPSAFRPASPQ